MYDYSDFYSYGYGSGMSGMEEMESAIAVIAGVYGVIMAFALLVGIAIYVMRSISLYSIANRRGLNHAWLAWLPIGNQWILGSVSDQYRYVVKGEIHSKRKVLLALSIVNSLVAWIIIGIAVVMMFNLFGSLDVIDYMSDAEVASMILAPTVAIMLFSFVLVVVGIVLMVFQYMALYDLFRSCDPNTSVVFLVLSIVGAFLLSNLLEPIFLLVVHKKDRGMPQYAQPAPYQPQPVYQQTWEQ